MSDLKVGIGYDIHRFVEGRPLILGGVNVPYERGLDGHSDADVLLHALCDALLGALGLGDIGEHFPNTDPEYKGIASTDLLKQVKAMIDSKNYIIGNADMVIQAEEPNLKKYKPQMQSCIAQILDLNHDCVSIKATTQEQLGAIGQKQGIAAFASVLLNKKK
ncbi:2-C-methyl-D-erythritol 2,4-cyclodiphosphate synthase [hydrothermal vent metagenome]|uniref:2-C-methyl-D-erythritol 2,4-cyclodiphosphate synthase n=1 Tax=hydrothermal vent metagenome TaxID=652676 RepID=A0A3B0T098_9ZZZZ